MSWILTGFHRAGKTTFGKRLSALTNLPFFDLDAMIESKIGVSIREFVREKGDLDQLENWAISHISSMKKGGVISLGGGTILCPQKASLLGQLGIIVYLKVSFETIWARIDPLDLPTFCDPSRPKESLLNLYNQRDPIYRDRADLTLDDGK
ncbi:MAG: shikimate kinase [Chlamydiia bacterium]|nr:shikimate kinase [Chlamydiia bacterium]